MADRVRLGMLTPSSNSVLEPVTAALLAPLDNVTAHFSRFPVTEISLSLDSRGQFDLRPMLEAARLLADARVRAICWNGTAAGWMGLDVDRRLCTAITDETGIAAVSAVLALIETFDRLGVRRYGLVTPYTVAVQSRIIATFEACGFRCAAEQHLDIVDNFAFADVDEDRLAAMIRGVAREGADAVTVLCTNLRAAFLAAPLEAELGLPILDSVAVALWGSLRAAEIDPTALGARGRLFREIV
jgi:maleate isomerase